MHQCPVDPGRLSHFVAQVHVPDDAAVGPARVIDDGDDTAAVLRLMVRSD